MEGADRQFLRTACPWPRITGLQFVAVEVISVDRHSRGEAEIGRATKLNAEGVSINAYDFLSPE
jgi:hypothetical protein